MSESPAWACKSCGTVAASPGPDAARCPKCGSRYLEPAPAELGQPPHRVQDEMPLSSWGILAIGAIFSALLLAAMIYGVASCEGL